MPAERIPICTAPQPRPEPAVGNPPATMEKVEIRFAASTCHVGDLAA
jgi:hypothetical protein